MAAVAEILTKMEAEKGGRLPRYESVNSGKVFSRLTSAQNLDPYRDRKIDINIRLPQLQAYAKASGQIFKIYIDAFSKKNAGSSELVEIFGHLLRASAVAKELFDEIIPTYRKDDPDYDAHMEGVERGRLGFAVLVLGCLDSLPDKSPSRGTEFSRSLAYMIETLPKIVPALTAEQQRTVMLRLDKLIQDPSKRDLHPELVALRDKINTALKE